MIFTSEAPDALEVYAEEVGAALTKEWGRIAIVHEGPFDFDYLNRISDLDNVTVIGRFGENRDIELRLSSDAPSDLELQALRSIAASESEERSLVNPADGWVAARHAQAALQEVEIRYDRLNWCSSLETLRTTVETDWMQIADTLVEGDVTIGSTTIPLRHIDGTTAIPILEPVHGRPEIEGPQQEVWDAMASLADAAAWREIAVRENRSEGLLKVALHRDQPAIIELDPRNATGGVALWKWLHATQDANRGDALRYILRFVTAAAVRMPNGTAVLSLAERYRIALGQDQAAEVQRAISESRALIRKGLQDARRTLSSYTEDTVKTAQAAVIAGVGIAALVARNAAILPDWLLGMVTIVAIVGVLTLMWNRWCRIGELGSDIEALTEALSEKKAPLLPESERTELAEGIDGFNAARKVLSGRAMVLALGLIAVSVILSAGLWIIRHDGEQEPEERDGATVEQGVGVQRNQPSG